ncbi:hypothetical protein [Novosphingobium cyanobacteriorum]|uniref:Uncharacterized protein n=1 Tax=Novosphingobium cyanobacteriorum TaxID=3024215 RepID=A0ABT6CNG9_9SPHN|nr:hypothetical protein [Novosphingobium cyanobacteriorum]MDF8333887.1 hypothetical protein [Novosphingobium cyanobacteriorum]
MTRPILLAAAALLALAPATTPAQTAMDPKDATPGQVVTKPLSDLNLKKDEIPPILQSARSDPYTLVGLKRCIDVQGEVARLDSVLGDDVDIAEPSRRGPGVGNIAKSIVGSLIPFGGVIRELTGANENQRQWQLALYAGTARRAFLKGYGQQKGCKYPARSATPAVKAARDAEAAKVKEAEKGSKEQQHRR